MGSRKLSLSLYCSFFPSYLYVWAAYGAFILVDLIEFVLFVLHLYLADKFLLLHSLSTRTLMMTVNVNNFISLIVITKCIHDTKKKCELTKTTIHLFSFLRIWNVISSEIHFHFFFRRNTQRMKMKVVFGICWSSSKVIIIL